MRSPPVVPYVYALESAMDEMAIKLGMDPIEFRRVNDTMTSPIGGKPYSSRSLMQCYDQAAAAFGWQNRTPRSMRDGDWLIGFGCATALYPTHVGPAAARVRLMPNGDVRVQTAAHEIGNGVYTVLAQVAAERLGVNLGSVRVEVGDSRLHVLAVVFDPPATGAGGKRGAKEKIEDVFKHMGVSSIEEYAEFIPPGLESKAMSSLYAGTYTSTGGSHGEKIMYAMGAEFVEVRVHASTCEIRVPRIVGAFAAGRLMNTRTVRSQLMGGMIWGISSALHEATEIDVKRARYVNDNLADYLVPVNADVKQVEVILVSEIDHDVNPAGVKGLGELANVGTAAAIANAVYQATGKRIRELPIRIESLLSA
jgi:xanthine dehydrogenase YagR molybdenum-binding subunit